MGSGERLGEAGARKGAHPPREQGPFGFGEGLQGEKTGWGAAPLPRVAAPSHTQVCTLPSPPTPGPGRAGAGVWARPH